MTVRTEDRFAELLRERILVLDGAMGSLIQSHGLSEADFRGELFADHPRDLQGNNDILCLTQPDIVQAIYREYLAAGADIITTNTFNGTAVSQAEYGTADQVFAINEAAARLAREAAAEFTQQTPDRPRFVAGSLAPTNRTCSISPDVNDPGKRNVTFDELVLAYAEATRGLLAGGADILLIETIFDTLNAKAALFAVGEVFGELGREVPIWISGTITDASGRTLTGQTTEAFWNSVRHGEPVCVGLNCALGAESLRPFLEELTRIAQVPVAVHPNAGLPNELGGYDETPEQMSARLREFAESGLVNVVGGCCGTTPEFIRAIATAVQGLPPRPLPELPARTRLSGLEPLTIGPDSLFVNIGERTNVAGSRKFARLINEGKTEEALSVARQQVRGGAQIIDVNMDDPLLDAEQAITNFLNVAASDPEIARVPVMVDSSRWSVVEAGLKCLQGKGIVNSLSLKDGEEVFRERARLVRRFGAALIVMAFDEQGQADTLDRRVAICRRAWRILTEEVGFPPEDIIFDPNVFAVATGLAEHNNYAVDFVAACRVIKEECPGCLISGGISNLSFSYRGNDTVREAMHSVFLYHAITAGLDLGIVNAGQLAVYEQIDPELRDAVEDVILNRDPEATNRLTEIATRTKGQKKQQLVDLSWRELPVAERLGQALVSGDAEYIEEDALASLAELGEAIAVIEGPLLSGMNVVGDLFGAGKMFLPQVIRSARVMKKAVAVLEPHLAAGSQQRRTAGSVLLATVKGDVHDIGKNIVGVVLGCNNYEVIDLGVMVPAERIVETAREKDVDIIGLSGLITPSLEEMAHVAAELARQGVDKPLLIGGATTSRLHTALAIDPRHDGPVIHVPDASRAAGVVGRLVGVETRSAAIAAADQQNERIRKQREQKQPARRSLPIAEARRRAPDLAWNEYVPPIPARPGIHVFDRLDLRELAGFIDWTPFFRVWKMSGVYPRIFEGDAGDEARRLFDDAQQLLARIVAEHLFTVRAVVGLLPANSQGDDIVVYRQDDRADVRLTVHGLRQQSDKKSGRPNQCLSDLVAPRQTGLADYLGAFTIGVTPNPGSSASSAQSNRQDDTDSYRLIMEQALADRLAEAGAEWLHARVRRDLWGYAADEDLSLDAILQEQYRGIRPAPGYPACPDHSEKKLLFQMLDAEANSGVRLTENCAMDPPASICGWYFSHPEARYFGLGKIDRDQVADYAERKGETVAETERWLAPNLAYDPS